MQRFYEVTGISLEDSKFSYCESASVTDTKDCEPRVGGVNWAKAVNVRPYTLTEQDGDGVNAVFASYIGHKFRDYDVDPTCPADFDPMAEANAVQFRRYTSREVVQVSLSSLYAEKAIERARIKVEAAAAAQGVQISGDAMAALEVELKKTIDRASEKSTDITYLQAYWAGGWTSMRDFDAYKKCAERLNPAKESMVTGIAGFILSNFESTQTYYESSWLRTSVETAMQGKFAPDVLTSISAKASAEWSSEVNKELRQAMKGKKFANTFHPLWIRFEKPSDAAADTRVVAVRSVKSLGNDAQTKIVELVGRCQPEPGAPITVTVDPRRLSKTSDRQTILDTLTSPGLKTVVLTLTSDQPAEAWQYFDAWANDKYGSSQLACNGGRCQPGCTSETSCTHTITLTPTVGQDGKLTVSFKLGRCTSKQGDDVCSVGGTLEVKSH